MQADRKNSDGEAANKPSRSSSQAATLFQKFRAYHYHVKQRTYQEKIPTDVSFYRILIRNIRRRCFLSLILKNDLFNF